MTVFLYLLGGAITTCRGTRQNILALKDDENILNALLKPIIKSTTATVTFKPAMAVVATKDPDAMTVVPQKFALKSKYSKST